MGGLKPLNFFRGLAPTCRINNQIYCFTILEISDLIFSNQKKVPTNFGDAIVSPKVGSLVFALASGGTQTLVSNNNHGFPAWLFDLFFLRRCFFCFGFFGAVLRRREFSAKQGWARNGVEQRVDQGAGLDVSPPPVLASLPRSPPPLRRARTPYLCVRLSKGKLVTPLDGGSRSKLESIFFWI